MKKLLISLVLVITIIVICNITAFCSEVHMENKELQLTEQDIKNALDKIPEVYTEDVNIYVLDKQYTERTLGAYWGKGKIEVYKSGIAEGEKITWNTSGGKVTRAFYIKDEIEHIISHEVGHKLQVNIMNTPLYLCYEKIVEKEPRLCEKLNEDFAESFSEYITNKEELQKNCPAKYVLFEILQYKLGNAATLKE